MGVILAPFRSPSFFYVRRKLTLLRNLTPLERSPHASRLENEPSTTKSAHSAIGHRAAGDSGCNERIDAGALPRKAEDRPDALSGRVRDMPRSLPNKCNFHQSAQHRSGFLRVLSAMCRGMSRGRDHLHQRLPDGRDFTTGFAHRRSTAGNAGGLFREDFLAFWPLAEAALCLSRRL